MPFIFAVIKTDCSEFGTGGLCSTSRIKGAMSSEKSSLIFPGVGDLSKLQF